MRPRWIFIVPAAFAGIVLLTLIGGKIVELLWNWLMPPLFGWRSITFWQGWGLLALCRILFGGMRVGGGHGDRRRMRERLADRMADRVAERWDAMSPEERQRFRQRLRDRIGFDPAGGPDAAP